jgi:hypothetical protein
MNGKYVSAIEGRATIWSCATPWCESTRWTVV